MDLNEAKVLRRKRKLGKFGGWLFSIVRAIIVLGICYYILFPILQSFFNSFMSQEDLYDTTVDLIPRHWTWDNYRIIFTGVDIAGSSLNSFLLSLVVTVTQLVSCTLVGYGLARFEFPLRNLLFGLVIFTLIVPVQTIIASLYLNFRFLDVFGIVELIAGEGINTINTAWPFAILGITATGFRNGLYIFLVRQFYRNVPKELEEAAMIDGAGYFKTFYRVMLPGAKPILSVVAVLSFVWQWTDYYYTGWFASNIPVLSTKLMGVANDLTIRVNIIGDATLDDGFTNIINSSSAIIMMIPVIVLYLFTQRMFVESIERGGIVG